jgi:tetratricopeptide (TPR) repeat protein
MCPLLSVNGPMLTIFQIQARLVTLDTMWPAALRFRSVPLGELPPPAPRECFGRDELIEKVIGLAENLKPIALIEAGGIGKTSIALTVLHHNRIEERFGENRRFIRCDQFPASRIHFLARLSKVIGAGVENPEDLTPFRPLLSSKEMLIILDNAESILDPKEAGAKEIYSVVDELCQFKKLCLCITSRITTVPPRCKPLDIPTLSMEAARDIFYDIYTDSGRPSTINDLLERLDFHALSIKLLATTASHNRWDHDRLAKEWDEQRAQVLQTDYNESLAATIELSLTSPTFRSLGLGARDLLGVVAFFPQGINEKNLDWLFPTISNRMAIFDKFCVLSLTYRSNGFVTMLAPIRDYLSPKDPQSSPLLCTTMDRYSTRLSVEINPNIPEFEEGRWIVLEDVNIEHLLDVFTSIDQTREGIWDVCCHFLEHLVWHKPRQTILASKIEALPDDHPSKPDCLSQLSTLFLQVGNHLEQKRLLTRTLALERQRGNEANVAQILRDLSDSNRLLNLYEEGIRQSKEALEIFERINDTKWQAVCLKDLAWAFYDDRQLDAAQDAASRAIELISGKGLEYIVCGLHRVLGRIYQSKGEREKAIHHFQTALGIASPSNWRDELFWNHYNLAVLFRNEDEFDDANAHIGQAKSQAVGDTYKLGRGMEMQAEIWYQQHRFREAKAEVMHALENYEKLGAAKDMGCCRDLLQNIEQAMNSRSTSPSRSVSANGSISYTD